MYDPLRLLRAFTLAAEPRPLHASLRPAAQSPADVGPSRASGTVPAMPTPAVAIPMPRPSTAAAARPAPPPIRLPAYRRRNLQAVDRASHTSASSLTILARPLAARGRSTPGEGGKNGGSVAVTAEWLEPCFWCAGRPFFSCLVVGRSQGQDRRASGRGRHPDAGPLYFRAEGTAAALANGSTVAALVKA